MIRIAICDDAAASRDGLAKSVEKWAKKRRFNVQIVKFRSGEDLLADFETKGYYDVVFMDIELKGGMDGIHTAEKIRKICEHICLIFISQYDDYYKDVFHVHPFQYLEKIGQRERLAACLDEAVTDYRHIREIFTFQFRGINYSVLLYKVLYFASAGRIIKVYVENDREYAFYGKLDELEKYLEGSNTRFVRIHKSFLVNGRQMERYDLKNVTLRNGESLPVSPQKKNNLTCYHMDYMVKIH